MRFEQVVCLLSVALLCAGNLFAGAPGYDRPVLNRWGQRGILHLYSAHTLGAGKIALGFPIDGTIDRTFVKSLTVTIPLDTGFDKPLHPAISSYNGNPFISAGITDFFDVSVTLPLAVDMVGRYFDPGIGDVRIASKLSAHSSNRPQLFDAGLLGAVSFATGSKKTGYFPRHPYYFNKDSLALDTPKSVPTAFYSSKKSDFEAHVLMTLDFGALKQSIPLAVHTDCGMHFATHPGNDDAVLLSGAIEWFPSRVVGFFTEFSSEMRLHTVTHGFAITRDPLHVSPGMIFTASNGYRVTMGGEFSLASSGEAYTYRKMKDGAPQVVSTGIEPKWRIFAQIGWSGVPFDLDRDGDGISDKNDECLAVPEDVDGFQDDDGCPDPDNDSDGLADSLDKCPGKAEDKDGFQDDDGCPEYDNDNDGVTDSLDSCPNAVEDHDGFQDKDGCPDYDNDADMVPDSADRCPNIPEDIDGFQDNDGCPDIDNDIDGVPDSLDRCPDQAGTFKQGGCPGSDGQSAKAKKINRGRVILRGVTFVSGTATIDPPSFAVLDKVSLSLADWPEVRIEIQSHTDEAATETARIELSLQRAECVRDYLVSKGIEAYRLSAAGKGDGDPIADNSSSQGRALNNRMEIRRTDP